MISSNPIRILKKLDSHLRKSIELVVYGKSALYLLFPNDNQIEVTIEVEIPTTVPVTVQETSQVATTVITSTSTTVKPE